jgi:hypothetical protein
MMTDEEKQEWAAKTVAILYGNQSLRQQFMTAYHSQSTGPISTFLAGPSVGMPKELVDEIVKNRNNGQALSDYIGQLVCDYLW